MIVVDVNVLLYLVLNGDKTTTARAVLKTEPEWCSPRLWRSEMLNALAGYIRRGDLDVLQALTALQTAARVVQVEPIPRPKRILDLISASNCTAYDCEYVAVAEALRVPLVTNDKQIIRNFPNIATSMHDFVSS